MRKTVIKILICAGVIMLAASVSAAYAQPCAYGMERLKAGKDYRFQKLAKELNLTDAQKEQIKAQRDSQEEVVKGLRERFHQEMENLRVELDKPDTDKGKIAKISTKIKAAGGDLFDQRINGILAMKEILTPQQYEQLSEKRKAKREKFIKFHKKMMKERNEEGLY